MVGSEVVPSLQRLTPTWVEEGSTVTYPPGLERIPKNRGAYFYYLAEAHAKGKSQPVLVRTSRNPLPKLVELFAPSSLKAALGLASGDLVEVLVHAI